MSETPCEWLDGLLNGDYDFTVYSRKNARAELAQLRAAADELQRIRELIDPLNGQSVYDAVDALLHDESSAEIYRIDMAEQERKLDEARAIIESGASIYNGSKNYASAYNARCQQ